MLKLANRPNGRRDLKMMTQKKWSMANTLKNHLEHRTLGRKAREPSGIMIRR
jgi:hypothetical protein